MTIIIVIIIVITRSSASASASACHLGLHEAWGNRPSKELQSQLLKGGYMGVSQNWGYLFGGLYNRTIIYLGLYWGPLILGNYYVGEYYREVLQGLLRLIHPTV